MGADADFYVGLGPLMPIVRATAFQHILAECTPLFCLKPIDPLLNIVSVP